MSIFYPMDNKPIQYTLLLVSISAIVIFNNNIYRQAIERNSDPLIYETYIQQNPNMHHTVNDMNLRLAGVGTGTNGCVVVVSV